MQTVGGWKDQFKTNYYCTSTEYKNSETIAKKDSWCCLKTSLSEINTKFTQMNIFCEVNITSTQATNYINHTKLMSVKKKHGDTWKNTIQFLITGF